jgi:hypothetical protein
MYTLAKAILKDIATATFMAHKQRKKNALQNGNAFDSACDPTGVHTTDGQHSKAYCTGWANGYDNTYHNITPALVGGVGPTSGNGNTPSLQSQGNTSPYVDVVNCHVTVEQKQNNEPTSNTGNSQVGY